MSGAPPALRPCMRTPSSARLHAHRSSALLQGSVRRALPVLPVRSWCSACRAAATTSRQPSWYALQTDAPLPGFPQPLGLLSLTLFPLLLKEFASPGPWSSRGQEPYPTVCPWPAAWHIDDQNGRVGIRVDMGCKGCDGSCSGHPPPSAQEKLPEASGAEPGGRCWSLS